jgi:hypothetical protein
MKKATWAIVLIVWFALILFSVATNRDLNKIDKRSLAGSMLGELLLIVLLAWIIENIIRFVYEKMPRFKVKTS